MKRLREFTRFCIKYDAPIAWSACAFMAAASTALRVASPVHDRRRPIQRCDVVRETSYGEAAVKDSKMTARARSQGPCTLENCGHMRQLDAIVDFLGMARGTRSVLDELRSRVEQEIQRPSKP